jgi:dihydrofolate synthase/folylpolyglutamate synthase
MSYSEAVQYLMSLMGDVRVSNFGLQRMERLTARLGEPQHSFRVAHVAGTNGKGSTAAMIESGLRAAGSSTGLYTSPHLVRFNERFKIKGQDASDEQFAAAVAEVRAANERLAASDGCEQHATLFESVTAAAFCAFRSAGVDWGVIEVGLGGRLDATNVVRPDVAVITPIDFDHEAFLGKSAEFIAGEKAGILKRGSKAVTAPQKPRAAEVIVGRAAELGIPLLQAGVDWRAENVTHLHGFYRFDAVKTADSAGEDRLSIKLPLAGEHQIENALAAIAALETVGISRPAIRHGIEQARWPGRLEYFDGRPAILLDAAHNPAGARVLARFLEKHHAGRTIHLIYGAVRDKAIDEVAGLLFSRVDRVILTRSRVSRSISPETLRQMVDHLHARIETAPAAEQAIDLARGGAQPEDLIVIAGSIFLIGEAKEVLETVIAKG